MPKQDRRIREHNSDEVNPSERRDLCASTNLRRMSQLGRHMRVAWYHRGRQACAGDRQSTSLDTSVLTARRCGWGCEPMYKGADDVRRKSLGHRRAPYVQPGNARLQDGIGQEALSYRCI